MTNLLAEIAAAEAPRAPIADRVRSARESVLAHLALLCQTPRGSMLLAPDYGVQDATHVFHEYPGSVEDLRRALEETIRRYEPRLVGVVVEHVPASSVDLVVRFEIHAGLVVDGRVQNVRFATTIDGDSQVELR